MMANNDHILGNDLHSKVFRCWLKDNYHIEMFEKKKASLTK